MENKHKLINDIINNNNLSDGYILASKELFKIYGEKTTLFLQNGQFYEMFDKCIGDPKNKIFANQTILKEICELCNGLVGIRGESYLMWGPNIYSCERYIELLIENGYNVVLTQQYDSGGNNLKRKITKVFSPGLPLITCNSKIDKLTNCNFMCLSLNCSNISDFICVCLSIIDVLNGNTFLNQFSDYNNNSITDLKDQLLHYISFYSPKELLIICYNKNENIIYTDLKEYLIKFCSNESIIYHVAESNNKEFIN